MDNGICKDEENRIKKRVMGEYFTGRKDAIEDILKSIKKGIEEDKEFANMKIKDAYWEQYLRYFIMKRSGIEEEWND